MTLINDNPNIDIFCDSHDSLDDREYLVSNIKGKIEIDFIINRKSKFLMRIFAGYNLSVASEYIAEYIINNEEENNPPLLFPLRYTRGGKGVKLIEPLYCPLKKGETIKFQIICEFSKELIVIEQYDSNNNITLTKEGEIFSGKFYVNSTRVEIRYLNEDGNYYTLFRYSDK